MVIGPLPSPADHLPAVLLLGDHRPAGPPNTTPLRRRRLCLCLCLGCCCCFPAPQAVALDVLVILLKRACRPHLRGRQAAEQQPSCKPPQTSMGKRGSHPAHDNIAVPRQVPTHKGEVNQHLLYPTHFDMHMNCYQAPPS